MMFTLNSDINDRTINQNVINKILNTEFFLGPSVTFMVWINISYCLINNEMNILTLSYIELHGTSNRR